MCRMRQKYLLISLISLSVVGVLASSGHSRIERETILGIWLFDEDTGKTVKDSSLNGNDGEIIGGAEWIEGKFGSALKFNGGTSFVQIPHSDKLSLQNFTVTAWVELEVGGKWQYILCKTTPNPPPWQRNYSIQVGTGDSFLGGFDDKEKVDAGQAPWTGIGGQTKLADNEWHHVAVTYDKEKLKAYIDGVMEGQKDIAFEPITNAEPIMIGTNVVNQGVNGIVDEVGLFSVALADDDIKAIVNEGLEKATGVAAVLSIDKLAATWGELRSK